MYRLLLLLLRMMWSVVYIGIAVLDVIRFVRRVNIGLHVPACLIVMISLDIIMFAIAFTSLISHLLFVLSIRLYKNV